jgi:hypothetical protein
MMRLQKQSWNHQYNHCRVIFVYSRHVLSAKQIEHIRLSCTLL